MSRSQSLPAWEVYHATAKDFLAALPSNSVQLIFTSPPYNVGKEYEDERIPMVAYRDSYEVIIRECTRVLRIGGSLCWQVGNSVHNGVVYPLDMWFAPVFERVSSLYLRNRIVWAFEHGLHAQRRFSGRHETILWYTIGHTDTYPFHLDPVRVPQKYPNKKAYKGPRKGQVSSHPAGKNPGDWWLIPNVKHNHVEKTAHPCQFPIALVERFVLATTVEGDLVVDPYCGSGTTLAAALLHRRLALGSDIVKKYTTIARKRCALAVAGQLPVRADAPVAGAAYASGDTA